MLCSGELESIVVPGALLEAESWLGRVWELVGADVGCSWPLL